MSVGSIKSREWETVQVVLADSTLTGTLFPRTWEKIWL
jgi:hypothetical protein